MILDVVDQVKNKFSNLMFVSIRKGNKYIFDYSELQKYNLD